MKLILLIALVGSGLATPQSETKEQSGEPAQPLGNSKSAAEGDLDEVLSQPSATSSFMAYVESLRQTFADASKHQRLQELFQTDEMKDWLLSTLHRQPPTAFPADLPTDWADSTFTQAEFLAWYPTMAAVAKDLGLEAVLPREWALAGGGDDVVEPLDLYVLLRDGVHNRFFPSFVALAFAQSTKALEGPFWTEAKKEVFEDSAWGQILVVLPTMKVTNEQTGKSATLSEVETKPAPEGGMETTGKAADGGKLSVKLEEPLANEEGFAERRPRGELRLEDSLGRVVARARISTIVFSRLPDGRRRTTVRGTVNGTPTTIVITSGEEGKGKPEQPSEVKQEQPEVTMKVNKRPAENLTVTGADSEKITAQAKDGTQITMPLPNTAKDADSIEMKSPSGQTMRLPIESVVTSVEKDAEQIKASSLDGRATMTLTLTGAQAAKADDAFSRPPFGSEETQPELSG